MPWGDECRIHRVESPVSNRMLTGVSSKWQNNISEETFASWCRNMQVVRHRTPGLFSVTAIPLGVGRAQFTGAGNGKRFGGGGPVRLQKFHAVRCVSGRPRQSNDYTQWVEWSAADTNAVQGETRNRALVTTVRGCQSFNRQHYGYQIEQILAFFTVMFQETLN